MTTNVKTYLKETALEEGAGFICLNSETRWYRTLRFHNMLGISWLAEKLLASHEGLGSMELVSSDHCT